MNSFNDYPPRAIRTETISGLDKKACLFFVLLDKNINRGVIKRNYRSKIKKKISCPNVLPTMIWKIFNQEMHRLIIN